MSGQRCLVFLAILVFALAAAAAAGDGNGLLLTVAGNQAQNPADVVVRESGPLALRVNAPGARAAWLFYRPDAGEPRQYAVRLNSGTGTAVFSVDAGTAGLLYLIARDTAGGVSYSNSVRIESAAHQALVRAASPDPQLRVEVNLPAFELRVYRANELLRKFRVGIGVKEWPVPPSLRLAHQVVWNPQWAPPDSPWATPALVRRLQARGEVLGRMKIPLGGEILIHGTDKPRDLGHLVSHGCIRMLNRDVWQLGKLLIAETGAPAAPAMVRRAEQQHKFSYGVKLPKPVQVYIRYEPVLQLAGKTVQLPDVYGWQPATQTPVNQKATKNRKNTKRAKAASSTVLAAQSH